MVRFTDVERTEHWILYQHRYGFAGTLIACAYGVSDVRRGSRVPCRTRHGEGGEIKSPLSCDLRDGAASTYLGDKMRTGKLRSAMVLLPAYRELESGNKDNTS